MQEIIKTNWLTLILAYISIRYFWEKIMATDGWLFEFVDLFFMMLVYLFLIILATPVIKFMGLIEHVAKDTK